MFCSAKVGPRSWFHSVRGMPLRLRQGAQGRPGQGRTGQGSEAGERHMQMAFHCCRVSACRLLQPPPTPNSHSHSAGKPELSLEVQRVRGALASAKQLGSGAQPGGQLQILVLRGTCRGRGRGIDRQVGYGRTGKYHHQEAAGAWEAPPQPSSLAAAVAAARLQAPRPWLRLRPPGAPRWACLEYQAQACGIE